MSEPDEAFLRSLRGIADDIPDQESVRSTVQTGYHRRLRRRRLFAIGSAAVVVLAVAGATTVMSAGQASTSRQLTPPVTSVATSKPTAGSSATNPANHVANSSAVSSTAGTGPGGQSAISGAGSSPFVAAPVLDLVSPVSLPLSWTSVDPDGASIRAGQDYLTASWTVTDITAGNSASASPNMPRNHGFGYLITNSEPSLTVAVITSSQGFTSVVKQAVARPVTVDGHAARYLTAPPDSYEATYRTPAQARMAWQLPDHRWIQLWLQGDDPDLADLIDFAAVVTNQPTRFPQSLSIGLTLKGITHPTVMFAPGQPPTVDMCAVPDTADGFHRSDNTCVSAFANRQSFDQALADVGQTAHHGSQEIKAATTVITDDGKRITVNTLLQIGMYKSGELAVGVQAPPTAKLSAQQLATLTASVQAPTNR